VLGIAHTVQRLGHEVDQAASGPEGIEKFRKHPADFVISDLKMEGLDGIGVLEAIRKLDADALFMIVTGFGTIETAVKAMQLGAFDFITKPFPPPGAAPQGRSGAGAHHPAQGPREARAPERGAARRGRAPLPPDFRRQGQRRSRPGRHQPGHAGACIETIRRVAPVDTTVLITGESGVGKERVARLVHDESPRAAHAFVAVNCGAVTETLLESELFGHARGAFTGATADRPGLFESAHGGTLLLDEVGELSPAMQVRLLRVLQEREVRRVGETRARRVDVRVLAATHRNLADEVAAGRFRQDLYYRLRVVEVCIPPLRARRADVLPLARAVLVRLAARFKRPVRSLSPEAADMLLRYRWPGNVRELENALERAVVLAEGPRVALKDLPANVSGAPTQDVLPVLQGDQPLPDILDGLEKQLILRAYEQAAGVKTECARLLGIKTSALYYKLEKYGSGCSGAGRCEPRAAGGSLLGRGLGGAFTLSRFAQRSRARPLELGRCLGGGGLAGGRARPALARRVGGAGGRLARGHLGAAASSTGLAGSP
jgi:two-component system response regulator HydG